MPEKNQETYGADPDIWEAYTKWLLLVRQSQYSPAGLGAGVDTTEFGVFSAGFRHGRAFTLKEREESTG